MWMYQIYWYDNEGGKGSLWRRSQREVKETKKLLNVKGKTVRYRRRYVPVDKTGLITFLNRNANKIDKEGGEWK